MPPDPDRTHSIHDDIDTILVTEQELTEAVDRIAAEVEADLAQANPVLVGVLTGAFVFLSDLVRRFRFPLEVDFIAARSYGDDTVACELEVMCDMACDVTDRHVLVVDDIADTGHTLSSLVRMLHERGAASVRTCCILDKPDRRECDFEPDYVGVTIPDMFVVGYGLDYAGDHRHLPFVGVLRPELYQSSQE